MRRPLRRPLRRHRTPALLLALALPLAACSFDAADDATPVPALGSAAVPEAAPGDPVDLAYDRLTPEQRVGQLFMIGMTTTGPSPEMYAALSIHAGGNAFLRGPSDLGVEGVAEVTRAITAAATVAGVRPFVSADQEGGNAQALDGDGFSQMPTGMTQGTQERTDLRADARTWGREMQAAGVTLDLAPVADVVPADVGSANAPIGYFRRQYGYTPDVASPAVGAFVRGIQKEGVAATVKHFPGLGRATGNTDSDPSATDPTVRRDPLLATFAKGVRAGSAFVMVSSAGYPAIDPAARACFSRVVIEQMLRGDLGFDGVVISDSFGSASVASVPAGQRAVRFLRAGGTMVLDTNYRDLAPMTAAVLAEAAADPAFAAVVETAVRRVLAAKERFGLLSPAPTPSTEPSN